MRGIFSALALATLAVTGCDDDDAVDGDDAADGDDPTPPDLPFEYTTEHLDIHSDVERCAGDLARWEAFINYAEVYMGVAMPDTVDVYVWEVDAFDGPSLCGHPAGGCYHRSSGRIYNAVTSVEHELVHAITTDLANHDAFFVEGIAEAVSGPTQFGQYVPLFPIKGSSNVDYLTAGHFVRWLLDVHGPVPLIEQMSQAGGVEQFEAIYEASLEDMTTAFFTDAPPEYPPLHQFPAPAFEPISATQWSSALDFSCDSDDIRGTDQGRAAIRELTIPTTGFYAFWTSTGGPIQGRSTSMSSPEDTSLLFNFAFELPPGVIAVIPLDAGEYEIRVIAPPGVETGTAMVWDSRSAQPVFPGGPP